jgi:2'-hydroxyisoflavone reductase
MKDMLLGMAKAERTNLQATWVPTTFLETEKVSAWSDMPVWVPAQGDSAGFAHRDIRRALKAGLTFRPLATTTVDTLDWFKKQPAERQAKLKTGLSPAREQEVLAHWKERAATPR